MFTYDWYTIYVDNSFIVCMKTHYFPNKGYWRDYA